MRDLIILLVHVLTTVVRLVRPGGVCRDRRIRSHQTSIVDPQSFAPTCPESAHAGSLDRWILFTLDSADEVSSGGNRVPAIDTPEFSSRDGAAQVSAAV